MVWTLLGTPPDNRPMDSLVEWRITDTGWLQVTSGASGAGSAFLNLAVDDLPGHLVALRGRGLEPGSIQNVNKACTGRRGRRRAWWLVVGKRQLRNAYAGSRTTTGISRSVLAS